MAYNKTVMFFFQKPENYYRQDFVRKIRAEKNGFEYLTLYEELLIESLNKDGVLANFFDDKIVPYTTKELSIIFNHGESIVKNGLEIFQKYKIIEKKEDGSYFIPDALKYTKRTTIGAQNKKKQRNNKKDKEEVEDICPLSDEDICLTYIEQETNIKEEIEINNNSNNSYSNTNIQLNNKYNSTIEEIINYLNIKSNKNFTTNNDFVTNWIIELLDSGYTIDDFKKVIDNKSDEWGNDPEKRKYLRPGTLFNPKNFNKYLIGNSSKKDKASFEDVMDDYLNGKESDSKVSI